MKIIKNGKIPLFFIVLVALLLRFINLGSNPPSPTWDEVAWGYNAYSLGIDGRDEFGRLLPYDYLESFGDFKPPVYAYLAMVPVKLFGLNEFSTRFPSAFFGTLTVLITFFLVKRLFYKSPMSLYYALCTALLLAVSPWHILLSRAAFEANIATFFVITGVWLFLKGIQEKPLYLSLSAVIFVLSLYTFNSARVIAPLLVIMLTIGFWKKLMTIKKSFFIALIVGILFLLPSVHFLLSPQARLRFQEVNIFSDLDIIKTSNQEIANDHNAWWSKLIHNRRLGYGAEFLKHYFDNLSFEFLFMKGDGNPKFSTQSVGQMYLWELPFFIAGILFLIKKKEENWWIVPLWLLLAIIPAGVARETPHALRVEGALPTFQLLVAYGFVNIFLLIKPKFFPIPLRKILAIIVLGISFFSLSYFIEEYFVHYPKQFSSEWQYGYKAAIAYSKEVENQFDRVYVTKELGRPYAYMLFYKKYDPKKFRQQAVIERNVFGFVTVKSFGKYYFDKDHLLKDNPQNVLYIDTPIDVPDNAKVLKTFYLLDGRRELVAYTL